MLDDDLSWSTHINHVNNKLLKYVSLFYKIRSHLTSECRKALYFALIYPHLVYAIELFGNATARNLKPLQILQNKLLRILQLKPSRAHSVDLFTEFDTFRLCDLYELSLLKLTHKIIHHPAHLPFIFQNYLTFNQDIHCYNTRGKNDIFVHHIKTNRGSKVFKFRSHQLWNHLPIHIKETDSMPQFWRSIKSLYINKYM